MAVSSGLSIASESRSTWLLSWPLAVGMLLFVALVNPEGLPLLSDPDSHWHIAVGHWMLNARAVPDVDSFSFTFAGQPWIAKEWLSQLLLAGAYDLAGWVGVMALAGAAVAASFAVLLRLLLRELKPLPALMFAAAAVVMMAPHFLARPHLLAFPFMLLWVGGLVRAVEQRRAPEPVLLVCMLLWANLHGGFTLGLMLTAAFALEAVLGARDGGERRALILGWLKFGVAAGLVACVTPYGPESILVTLRIFGLGDALGTIAEWRSPDFHGQPMQEVILLLGTYLALSRGLKLPLVRLLVVLGLLHLYLQHARNAELLATLAPLAIAPLLARQFPTLRPDGPARTAGIGAVGLAVAVGLLFTAFMMRYVEVKPPGSTMPQAALAWARDAGVAKGRVLNHYNFGGYLIGAGIPTFIDGRGELYGGDFIKRYAEAINLRGEEPLEALLERWRIDWTLLTKDAAANKLLARLPGWRRAYGDDQAVIFVRER